MLPTNILQNVVTYNRANLALLENQGCFVSTANTKFKDFNNFAGNLGASVAYDQPPRFVVNDTLVVTDQPSVQRVRNLTVDRQKNVAYDFSAQQFIFNVEQYMDMFGRSAMAELGTTIEADVAGLAETIPYRFFGSTITPINSYTQLSTALMYYRNYGAPLRDIKVYLPDTAIPAIIGTGLNQFALNRNNEDALSWMVGDYDSASFYRSNLLPIHTAGTIGETNTTLTITAISPDGSSITFSGATGGATAVLAFDNFQILDAPGLPNVRYVTFIGRFASANPVQFQATANATEAAGSVTVNITPSLNSTAGDQNRNLNVPIASLIGRTVSVAPSHRCGLIVGGGALYLAMPRLPDEAPFPTGVETDQDTGVSLRSYYGAVFGQNQRRFVHDTIWGRDAVPEYTMKLIFPV